MTFFERELRKIVSSQYPEATYVGRACYIRLDGMNRAKLYFESGMAADQYTALRVMILNTEKGQLDTVCLRFKDIWDRVNASIWDDQREPGWYGLQPTSRHYKALADALTSYLDVFQEQDMEPDPVRELGQSM